ncbi:MAG: molybdopterin-binding protein [Planctomycetota bacterium]
MPRTAEILALGTELTTGAKLDTNSRWLSTELASLGITTTRHTTIGDDLPAIVAAVRDAAARADVLIIGGGLGPTKDDLTRQALAEAAGVSLELDAESLRQVEAFFAGRGRPMPETNRIQAMFPAGATPIENPLGTAPGVWLRLPGPDGRPETGCDAAAMPGVPREMHAMFHGFVAPRVKDAAVAIRSARVNVFGIGESATEELLGDLTDRGREPEVGITAHEGVITLRIVARGQTESECLAAIEADRVRIRRTLGELVFGEEDDTLESVAIDRLAVRGWTVATVEPTEGYGGTYGLVANRLAVADTSDAIVRGGLLVPENDDVEARVGEARERFGADVIVVVGKPTDPSVRERGTPPGPTAMKVITPDRESSLTHVPAGEPLVARSRCASAAIDLLRRTISAEPGA